MISTLKERLKSPVVWTSSFALIFFILKKWLCLEIPQFDEFMNLFLGVLIAFGIVNNPTDKENF